MAQLEKGRYIFLLSETTVPDMEIKAIPSEGINKITGEKVVTAKYIIPMTNCCATTANGNMFERDEMEPSIAKSNVQDRLKNNCFTGEFQHPTRDNPERYIQVYDEKVSHRFNRIWFEKINGDDVLMGEAETAPYAFGPDLRNKIAWGAIPACSYRGSGELYTTPDGRQKKDLYSVTWDNVFLPAEKLAWAQQGSFQMATYGESSMSAIKHLSDKELCKLAQKNWNSMNRMERHMFAESFIIQKESEANKVAKKAWITADASKFMGVFKAIDDKANLFGESFKDATVEKIGILPGNNDIVGFKLRNGTGTVTVIDRRMESKLAKSVNDLFRGL